MKNPAIPNVQFDKALRIRKGLFVHNPYELYEQISLMTEKEFSDFHSSNKTKIEDWVLENYQDKETFNRLKKTKSRRQYLFHIQTMIRFMEEQNSLRKPSKSQYGWIVFFGLIVLMVLYYIIQAPPLEYKGEDLTSNEYLMEQVYDYKLQIDEQNKEIEELKTENQRLLSRVSDTENSLRVILPTEEVNPTPRDRIKLGDIIVTENNIIINIDDVLIAEFADTGSMLPVLSSSSTALQIKPLSEEEIHPGDIISYRINDDVIIHRVIEVGTDFEDWYAITKGDNNPLPDKEKVRFDQIERVLVAIIY